MQPTPPLLLCLPHAPAPQGRRALAAVHVVILLLDAAQLHNLGVAMQKRDIEVAATAIREGKALLIALSKGDLVPGGWEAAEKLRGDVAAVLERRFTEAGQLPVVITSSVLGEGREELMEEAVVAYVRWNKR